MSELMFSIALFDRGEAEESFVMKMTASVSVPVMQFPVASSVLPKAINMAD